MLNAVVSGIWCTVCVIIWCSFSQSSCFIINCYFWLDSLHFAAICLYFSFEIIFCLLFDCSIDCLFVYFAQIASDYCKVSIYISDWRCIKDVWIRFRGMTKVNIYSLVPTTKQLSSLTRSMGIFWCNTIRRIGQTFSVQSFYLSQVIVALCRARAMALCCTRN